MKTKETISCGDDRFEVIAKAKTDILAHTNIESSPEEMAVLDNFLFRAWQMGWLSKEQPIADGLEEEINRTYQDRSVTDTSDIDHNSYENIARHFYELGRQSKEIVDAELVDLVDSYLLEHRCDILLCPRNGLMSFAELIAQWQKEQMMKGAVEHYVVGEIAGSPVGPAIVHYDDNLTIGDKVRIVILKEEWK